MEPIDIYKKKQLMIDNDIIEMSGGARHAVHPWEKDSGNPVLSKKDCDILDFNGTDLFPERHDTHYEFISRKHGENDGGGLIVTEDVQMIRVICRAKSRDFVKWTDNRVILEPNEYDDIDAQYHTLPVFEYEGIYMYALH